MPGHTRGRAVRTASSACVPPVEDVATEDLGTLRAEVESNLRKVEGLITEINRKWPFKRDTEIKLP
jgi:hypothetical protein